MLAERLARLLGSVLVLAALVVSAMTGAVDTGASFEWGASFGEAVFDGPAASADSLLSVDTGGNL